MPLLFVPPARVHPEPIRPQKVADFQRPWCRLLPELKAGRFVYRSAAFLSIHGEAPKNFIRAYLFEEGRRSVPVDKWPWYIAKVGHKWYPNESITEHLITRIGQTLEVGIADSRLCCVAGQVRFMSRYFLQVGEALVHGAELFARLLNDEMVREIARQRIERDFYTFQMVDEALAAAYPDEHDRMMRAFVRMLGFDALVGNNDRHPYNWGVIESVRLGPRPRFAPVFDSARGLFWQETEARVLQYLGDDVALGRYVAGSKPQLGCDHADVRNHFDLVRHIAALRPHYADAFRSLVQPGFLNECARILENEFEPLMSTDRRRLVLRCLERRYDLYQTALEVPNAR